MIEALHQFRESTFALADEINPNVYRELPQAVADLRSFALRLRATDRHVAAEPLPVTGGDVWKVLSSLSARALPPDSLYGGLAAMGAALGRMKLGVYEDEEYGRRPCLGELLRCLHTLPEVATARSPLLEQLKRLPPDEADLAFERYAEGRPWENGKFRVAMLHSLDECRRAIEEYLEEVPPVGGGGGSLIRPRAASTRPTWAEAKGVLSIGGRVARSVKTGTGRNITQILNEFEAKGWPNEVRNPLPENRKTPEKVHEAVRSLNEGLQGMSFHVQGDYIAWKTN